MNFIVFDKLHQSNFLIFVLKANLLILKQMIDSKTLFLRLVLQLIFNMLYFSIQLPQLYLSGSHNILLHLLFFLHFQFLL